MRWSKLRKIVELRFAGSLSGRIRLESTHYRRAHDQEGRWGVVIDGQQVWGMGCIVGDREQYVLSNKIRLEKNVSIDVASNMAFAQRRNVARHNQYEFHGAVWDFTQISIDDALKSEDAVIRSLAYLDARTGKRRLVKLAKNEPATHLECACLKTRLQAENIAFDWNPDTERALKAAPNGQHL
jgi:hypothetical protein